MFSRQEVRLQQEFQKEEQERKNKEAQQAQAALLEGLFKKKLLEQAVEDPDLDDAEREAISAELEELIAEEEAVQAAKE
jgi:hypothetical protein